MAPFSRNSPPNAERSAPSWQLWASCLLLTCGACNPSPPAGSGTSGAPSAANNSSGGSATAGTASTSGAPTTNTGTRLEAGEPRDSANVYWLGHSLISHTDSVYPGAQPLNTLLGELAGSAGHAYSHYKHTTPGAPIGWNWGRGNAWNEQRPKLQPLLDSNDPAYGSFDVMVVTESVPITSTYKWWASSFYARHFFCAAQRANPEVSLYLYESWPHFQAGDPEFKALYGAPDSYDFVRFLREEHALWVAIAEEAADPARTAKAPDDYTWQGEGDDPGECDDDLRVQLIPSGPALANLLDRMREQRAGDDWSYDGAIEGNRFGPLDLWQNPLTDFPADTQTTAHGGELDDIHPSHALAYFNALVHYASIYRRDPEGLAALNGVPTPIASIMQEVAWETVRAEPLSGVAP